MQLQGMKASRCFMKAVVLLGAILMAETASGQPVSKLAPWFASALEYVENDKGLIDADSAPRPTGLQYLKTQDETASRLSRLPAPSIEELLELLSSPDVEDRRVGLATAMIFKVKEVLFARSVLQSYLKEDDYLVKHYSHALLASFTVDELLAIETELLNALEHERVGEALIASLPNMIRLSRDKIRPLLIRYLKLGSPSLRRATVVYMVQLGKDFVAEVKTELERDKANEALMLLREVEESTSLQ